MPDTPDVEPYARHAVEDDVPADETVTLPTERPRRLAEEPSWDDAGDAELSDAQDAAADIESVPTRAGARFALDETVAVDDGAPAMRAASDDAFGVGAPSVWEAGLWRDESPAVPVAAARALPEPPSADPAPPARAVESSDKRRGFGGTIGWTILGAIIPGVGLWRSGHRVVGGVITGVFVVVVGLLAGAFFFDRQRVLALATQPSVLMGATIALAAAGLLWVIVIGATHVALRRPHPTMPQRVAGSLVVGLLSVGVMAPMALGANLAYTTSTLVGNVFAPAQEGDSATVEELPPVDPWAKIPRLNVLILGGDHDKGRSDSLGDRTDTVILASIDTQTGATTLFSLPRQTAKMPFPKDSKLYKYFPQGWYDGRDGANAEYMLNAMSRNLPHLVPKDVLGKTKYLGFDALKLSVGEALGLHMDYFVMVDMDGFKDFINAIGGVTLNVNYEIPIGGQTDAHIPPRDYIHPGPNQHMSGSRALWYARGRYGLDDYSRMERQRCVINAVVQQTKVTTVLAKFESIAAAGAKSITTDIPQDALPALITVAERVHGTTIRSVVFRPGVAGFVSADPDFGALRQQVQKALAETVDANASASPTASPSPATSPTTASPKSDNLDDACAYHPDKATKK